MGKKKESQEADKYGKITFGEVSKLLVGIIGENAILDLMPKKHHDSYEKTLQRMYNGEMPYNGFDSLQGYCEKFFKKIESKYEVSPLVMTSLNKDLKSFIWDFSLYAESNILLDKPKNEIALYLLYSQAFHHIDEIAHFIEKKWKEKSFHNKNDDSSEKDSLSIFMKKVAFKISKKYVLVFLTDSYKKVFDEIMQVFKNKETFYKEINNYCDNNREKYPKLSKKEVINYKQNIINWQNENVDDPNYVYNPNWRTLVPVLDYLSSKKHISFVHRLIGLYLRKNAQKAFADIFDVSEDELKEIIEKIVKMIEDKKRPENIPYDLYFDDIWFRDQIINIAKCLQLQNNYENSIDVKQSNNFIEYLKRNFLRSSEGKFLYFWLQTRAKVFEKHSDLEDHREVQEEILKGYREAIDELLNGTESPFDQQFLIEIMLINYIFYPRRVKNIKYYYEHGCTTLEIFNAKRMSWEKMLNILKEFPKDIRKALVNIHSEHCPIEISPLYIPMRISTISL